MAVAVRQLAILAVVLVMACSSPPTPPLMLPMTRCGFVADPVPAELGIGTVGEPLSIELAIAQSCPPDVTMSAVVSVLDPKNEPIAIEPSTRPVQPNANGVRTTVSFTPTTVGPYHAVARFEPNLGTAQVDVAVAADRRQVPATFALSGEGWLTNCTHFDVTPASRVVCLSPSFAAFSPDGGVPLQVVATRWAGHASGVVWMLEGDQLSRWVEREGPGELFQREPATTLTLPSSPMLDLIFAPGHDELVGATLYGHLFRVDVSDGGLSRTQLPDTAFRGSSLWRVGDQVLVVGYDNFCEVSLDAGTALCGQVNGGIMAIDPSGAWFVMSAGDGFFTGLGVLPSGSQAPLPRTVQPIVNWQTVTRPWNASPILGGDNAVYLPAFDRQISFARWPKEPPVVEATRDWLVRRDGSTVYFFRR